MEDLLIGICDDDNRFMQLLKEQLKVEICKYFGFINVKIFCYENGDEFLNSSHKNFFHIAFIDIEMPQKSGFEIANDVNLLYPNTSIIFVSSHESYVFDSYEYTPLWFVRKETYSRDLLLALRKYFKVTKYQHLVYQIKIGKVNKTVFQKDILYFECRSHEIMIKMLNEEYQMYGSLNHVLSELKNENFIRVHRSFLVNSIYISGVSGKKIVLKDGSEIDLGRMYKNEVKKRMNL